MPESCWPRRTNSTRTHYHHYTYHDDDGDDDDGDDGLCVVMVRLLSINVLEHVQDAFRYLTSLYMALKSGGRLIFHERYYNTATLPDGDLYHPVRVTRPVLDKFLSGFHVLFNNCSANYDHRPNERGYYVIAIKK